MQIFQKTIIGACISIPLLYFSSLHAGFNAPKIMLLGVFVFLLVIIHVFYSKSSRKPSIEFSLLFVALILVSFLGLNPVQSFFSYPERGTGVVTFSVLSILTILLSQLLNSAKLRLQLLVGMLVVGFCIITFGLLQKDSRIYSTIGNPVEAAGYIMLLFWLVIYFFSSPHLTINKAIKIAATLILLSISAYFIYRTKSRSAVFAIPLSGILAVSVLLYQRRKHTLLLIGFALSIILGLILIQNYEWLLLNRKDDSHMQRLGFYQLSWKAFLQSPIWGYGPENFLEISYQNYTASLSIINTKLDRAHSIFSEWLMSGGILVMSILAYFVYRWIKVISQLPSLQKMAMFGFTFSYFIWGMVSIDNISMYILIFPVVGIVLSQAEFKSKFLLPFSQNWLFVPIALLGIFQSISLFENTSKITTLRQETDIQKAFEILQNTISISIFPESTLESFTEKINIIDDITIKKKYGDTLVDLFAKYELTSTHSKNLLAKIYSDIGEVSLAKKEIEQSLLQSPNQPMALKQMAVLQLNAGDPTQAKAFFSKAYKLNPKDQLPLIQNLAIDLFYLNGKNEAEQLYANLLNKLDNENYHTHFIQVIEIGLAAGIPTETFDFIMNFIDTHDNATILNKDQYAHLAELAKSTSDPIKLKHVIFLKSTYGPFADNQTMPLLEKSTILDNIAYRILYRGEPSSIINELDDI
ncbi:O-antigen ligase [Spirosomataceae bacterium TFI 002]|nr:O-antigen ligase [Spirosomataceae bacterium TFI 002]